MLDLLTRAAQWGLGRLKRALDAWFALALARPRSVVIGFSLFTCFFALFMPLIHTVISPEDTIGSKFASIEAFKVLKKEFALGNSLQIVFKRKDGGRFSLDDICNIYEQVRFEAFHNYDLEEIKSPLNLRKGLFKDGIFTLPLVVEFACRASRDGLHSPKVDLLPLGTTPWGAVVSDRSFHDLLFEFCLRDEKDGAFGDFNPVKVDVLLQRLTQNLAQSAPHIDVIPTGYAYYKYFIFTGYIRQMIINAVMMLLLGVAIRLCFGRWLAAFLMLFSLTVMSLIVYGTMGLFGIPIDMLTIGLLLIISLAAAQDFLFVSHRMLQHGDSWRESLKRYLLPSFLTSFTTIVGFGSLCTSHLATIQRFGFLAAYGALLEWVIIYWYFPALFTLFPGFKHWVDPKRAISMGFLAKLAGLRPGRKVIVLMIIAFVVSPLTILTFRVTDNPKAVFPAAHEVNYGLDYLQRSRGWLATCYVVFRDQKVESFNREVMTAISRHENVRFIDDPYAAIDFLARGLPAGYRSMVKPTFVQSPAYSQYFSREGRALATVYLNSYSLDVIGSLSGRLTALCPHGECELLGPMVSQYEFSQKVIPTLTESLTLSLFIIVTTLWLLCRACGEKHTAAVIFSSVWGAVTVISFIKLFNMDINYIVCIFASVLVGIAGDNAIQYLFNDEAGPGGIAAGIAQKGAGSVLIAGITGLLTLLMLGAAFKPIRTLGVLFACGIVLALAGDLWLLAGMIACRKGVVNPRNPGG